MSKDLSAEYYQDNRERLQKKDLKRFWLSIEKNIMKWEKNLIIIIRNYFYLENQFFS